MKQSTDGEAGTGGPDFFNHSSCRLTEHTERRGLWSQADFEFQFLDFLTKRPWQVAFLSFFIYKISIITVPSCGEDYGYVDSIHPPLHLY